MTARRWLVTGAGGLLGSALVAVLAGAGEDVVALDRGVLDVTDPAAVGAALAGAGPALVVNTAAFTDVDGAERAEAAAVAVNAAAPAHLAAACARTGARLVHVSTDYVFAGDAGRPYAEDDPVHPLSAYGRSKAAGERPVLAYRFGYVVRTAWLYAVDRPGFVATMVARAAAGAPVDVVDDQHGCPTWAPELARGLLALGAAATGPRPPAAGVYHAVGAGRTSRWGLARAVYAAVGADPGLVRPITSAAAGRPAPRPARAVLSTARWAAAGLPALASWPAALHAALTGAAVAGTAGARVPGRAGPAR